MIKKTPVFPIKITGICKKTGKEKKMNQKQYEAALASMLEWLEDPHELGAKPYKTEYVDLFEYNGMTYYIFRFRPRLFSRWLLGVAGGFEGDETEPCGHTWSDFQPYTESSAKEQCIQMIERIMDYWKEQARLYQK